MKTLLRQNIRAIAVCLGLAMSLTLADDAMAQDTPEYRMRFPAAGTLVPRSVSPVRPPRLTVTPPRSSAEGARRQFFSPSLYFDAYPFGWYGHESPDDSAGDYPADSMLVRDVDPAKYSTEVKPARNIQTLDDSTAVGKLQVTEETDDSRKAVRLTWRDDGVGATQVAFFLADSSRAVLAAETVRSPPFTWAFELQPRTAFAGMTVVLPGGSLVTQYVAIRR
jgi:hypothetical protein